MLAIQNILLTTDLSENAEAAVPYALELARRFGATVHLVHVFDDSNFYATPAVVNPEMHEEWVASTLEEVERAVTMRAAELAADGQVPVRPLVVRGHPVDEIVKTASRISADCIVIATRGRTGLAHLLFGSVAERIIRHSVCPVLSVRPTPREA